MLMLCLLLIFFAVFTLILGVVPIKWEDRPTLKLNNPGYIASVITSNEKKNAFKTFIRKFSVINKGIGAGLVGRRISKDLGLAQIQMTADEFLLVKEIIILVLVAITFFVIKPGTEIFIFGLLMSVAGGYYLPELWLKGRKA